MFLSVQLDVLPCALAPVGLSGLRAARNRVRALKLLSGTFRVWRPAAVGPATFIPPALSSAGSNEDRTFLILVSEVSSPHESHFFP